jgi:histidinol-phosphate/aromatic aminotransferase/cobyric acid decarboxylase-like protein
VNSRFQFLRITVGDPAQNAARLAAFHEILAG